MRPLQLGSRVWLAAAGFALTATAAHSDDWLQFRKDGGRTGASQDATRFPITDVWIWSTRGVKDTTPTYEVAVQQERVWFLAREGKYRNLVCANSKTGTPLWRVQLNAPELLVRGVPAISSKGVVYTYDTLPGRLPATTYNTEKLFGNIQALTREPLAVGGFAVRAFDSRDGRQLAVLPLEAIQLQGDLSQVVLLDGGGNEKRAIVRPSNRPTLEVGSLGPPLLTGDEFMACTQMDLFLRWSPGRFLFPTVISHGTPKWPNEFWGFPPVATSGGVLIADDQTRYRFALAIAGENFHSWHLELFNCVGVPAADSDIVCMGIGGLSAKRGLICINSASGAIQWIYAPAGLGNDELKGGRQKFAFYKNVPVRVQRGTSRRGAVGGGSGSNGAVQGREDSEFRIIRKAGQDYVARLESRFPPGHESSGGVVLTEKRVYAQVGDEIVALDRSRGIPQWRRSLPPAAYVQSLVASSKHLLACYTLPTGGIRGRTALPGREDKREGRRRLVEHIPYWDSAIRKTAARHFVTAYQLKDGKQVWQDELLQPGTFALAEGLIYFANGDLTAYGPAERTYLVAADSDDSRHYVRPIQPKERDGTSGELAESEMASASPEPESDETDRTSAAMPPPDFTEARADCSLLRLSYGEPEVKLLEQVRDRVKLLKAKEVPLSLELDWLDARRAGVRGGAGIHWTDATASEFVALCARLAAEAGPAFFDVAPEANVYLRRYPDQMETVLGLLTDARLAIKQAAPGCLVVASLNVEVLLDLYGKGLIRPFGDLPKAAPQPRAAAEAQLMEFARIAGMVDGIGLTLRPQTAFRNTGVLPPDYLLRLRRFVPGKPMLVTRIVVEADAPGRIARGDQAGYARRVLQCCYWLNARMVAQPELMGYPETAVGENGGRTDPIRQIAQKWQRVVTWERVNKLTAKPPQLASPLPVPAPETGSQARQ